VSSEEVKIIRTELWYSGVAGSGRSGGTHPRFTGVPGRSADGKGL
jgi:hypothetical protein